MSFTKTSCMNRKIAKYNTACDYARTVIKNNRLKNINLMLFKIAKCNAQVAI